MRSASCSAGTTCSPTSTSSSTATIQVRRKYSCKGRTGHCGWGGRGRQEAVHKVCACVCQWGIERASNGEALAAHFWGLPRATRPTGCFVSVRQTRRTTTACSSSPRCERSGSSSTRGSLTTSWSASPGQRRSCSTKSWSLFAGSSATILETTPRCARRRPPRPRPVAGNKRKLTGGGCAAGHGQGRRGRPRVVANKRRASGQARREDARHVRATPPRIVGEPEQYHDCDGLPALRGGDAPAAPASPGWSNGGAYLHHRCARLLQRAVIPPWLTCVRG